jgi:hypothetical protein
MEGLDMKPELHASRTSETGPELYKLVIAGGKDPGAEVLRDFIEVAGTHALPPQGGCFNVVAIDPQGNTQSFLGGMYVQPSKYAAVSEQLTKLGYRIESAL